MRELKNYRKWISDGILVLKELTPREVEMIKTQSPCAETYYYSNEYLLNTSCRISEGVLYLEGMLHVDKLIRNNKNDYSIKDLVLPSDTDKVKEYRDKYWIGPSMMGPYKRKRFKLSKFRRVMEFDKTKLFIEANRYVVKKGLPFTYRTSNFRIFKYEE